MNNDPIAIQNQIAVLQAQSSQNDANYAVVTAQYNQRKYTITQQITTQQAALAAQQA